MSNHREAQEFIIAVLAFGLLLFFGIMSLRNPYWLGMAFVTILLSAIVTWIVAMLFQGLIELIFDIRFNIRGQVTLNYKYTTQGFGIVFAFLLFLTTSIVAYVIDQNLSVALIPIAERYRDGNISNILGWGAIILAILSAAYGIFVAFVSSAD